MEHLTTRSHTPLIRSSQVVACHQYGGERIGFGYTINIRSASTNTCSTSWNGTDLLPLGNNNMINAQGDDINQETGKKQLPGSPVSFQDAIISIIYAPQ
jgi:hypothetical protein